MCVSANTKLPDDVRRKFEEGYKNETTEAGREIFRQLLENADLAFETKLPLCQDCGLAIFYVEMGEDVVVPGGLNKAITEGMKCGVGLCGRCNIGGKFVCVDGPVFTQAQLKGLPQEF